MLCLFQTTLLLLAVFLHSSDVMAEAQIMTATNFKGLRTDYFALLAFKSKIIEDPQHSLSSWNDSSHICKWQGITCGRRHRRVTTIDLAYKGLVGSLSPFLGNLSFLHKINISNNNFQGQIPPQVGHLHKLQVLDLSTNSLQGAIPANISRCINLLYLDLAYNNLTRNIPQELGSLSKLEGIRISNNGLTRGLEILVNITSLEEIIAPYNNFEGRIPTSIGRLERLKFLYLAANKLYGDIPQSIFNLSSLIGLCLPSNQLEGTLPPNIGLTLPNLWILNFSNNSLTGTIPMSLANLSNILNIGLEENKFTGRLLFDGGRLKHLRWLTFGYNDLGYAEASDLNFVDSLVNCSHLTVLDVGSNNLGGSLPRSLFNLSVDLRYMLMEWNQIVGEIPVGLGKFLNLEVLVLEGNQLTGEVRNDLGKLKNLQIMSLKNNNLSGVIPSSLGNLSMISRLYFDHNRFHGPIPSTLGNCWNLLDLDLSSNDLKGLIPAKLFHPSALFTKLQLSQNNLEGTLPAEVGELKNIVQLSVANNRLSGKIPNTLGDCTSLIALLMEGNLFHGTIPPSLSSLKSMQYLDFSNNNLVGIIPSYLSDFDLLYLNLSFNNLVGEVPMAGVFANLSGVSLNGNSKLCGGIVGLNLPRCSNFREIKRRRRSISVTLTIMIAFSSVLAAIGILSALLYLRFKWKRKQSSSSQSPLRESFRQVSYEMLLKATDGFSVSHLIGTGSFGSVYRGILNPEGITIAVKVLNLQCEGASKSFLAECEALRNIRHRNLVRIITACSSIDFKGVEFKALVYELMPNGSLETWLHPSSEEQNNNAVEFQNLTLIHRINIATDVAFALDYLQHGYRIPIIHCDLKPSNILLDADMTAHVGDFGLAKFFTGLRNPNQSSSIGLKGTIGYAAPEYGLGSKASVEGDVYSYGILLLEMITGRRPTDQMFNGGLSLHKSAVMALPDQVIEIIDPRLLGDDIDGSNSSRIQRSDSACADVLKECLTSMVRIGVACSLEPPQDRMSISDVIHELQSIKPRVSNRSEFSDRLILHRRTHLS